MLSEKEVLAKYGYTLDEYNKEFDVGYINIEYLKNKTYKITSGQEHIEDKKIKQVEIKDYSKRLEKQLRYFNKYKIRNEKNLYKMSRSAYSKALREIYRAEVSITNDEIYDALETTVISGRDVVRNILYFFRRQFKPIPEIKELHKQNKGKELNDNKELHEFDFKDKDINLLLTDIKTFLAKEEEITFTDYLKIIYLLESIKKYKQFEQFKETEYVKTKKNTIVKQIAEILDIKEKTDEQE